MNKLIAESAVAVTPHDTNYITDFLPLPPDVQTIKICTAVAVASDLFTLANHGLNNNDVVKPTSLGTITSGIALGGTYFVLVQDANTFKLAISPSGTAIDIGGANTTPPVFEVLSVRTQKRVQGTLFIGVGGDVVVLPTAFADNNSATPANRGAVLFKNVPSGTFLPVAVKKVFATGTSATNIICQYD